MSGTDVDLFVIGAGSGGVRAARIAAGYGARVMIAEEFRVGGTCVIRGCVPKKLYVYAGRFKEDFEDAAGFGWSFPARPTFDWGRLVAAKEGEITRLSKIYSDNLTKAGVEIIERRARLDGPKAVVLSDGRRVTAQHVLVAVGASPARDLPIEGLDLTISSNDLFDLPKFPKRLLVIGGGYIAVEFASAFAHLGAEVVQVMRADNVLRGFDPDMRQALRQSLELSGVNLKFGVLPVRIAARGDQKEATLSDGSSVLVDQVLLATGRRPHTDGLGLEEAGVELDKAGAVVVDAYSRTRVDSVSAVGDVTNRFNLTPVAIREGHAFADTVFGGKPTSVVHANIPTAVFTTPEIGTVGLTEDQARKAYDVVDIYSASFRPMKATLSGRQDRTVMKLVVDGSSDRVLGVHIFGHDAGEMIQLAGVAVRMGATKADFDATMAVHPTAAEELVTMRTRSARHERAAAGSS